MGQSASAVLVCKRDDIAPGTTRKFLLRPEGAPVEAFVVNVDGALHGWLNRCRHVAMTMDWAENRFFDESGQYIACATHGALYRPDTGTCIGGPPLGRTLIRVPIRVEGDDVLADLPPELGPATSETG